MDQELWGMDEYGGDTCPCEYQKFTYPIYFVHMLIMPVTIIYVRLYVSMAVSSWFDIVELNQSHQNIANQNNFINAYL